MKRQLNPIAHIMLSATTLACITMLIITEVPTTWNGLAAKVWMIVIGTLSAMPVIIYGKAQR